MKNTSLLLLLLLVNYFAYSQQAIPDQPLPLIDSRQLDVDKLLHRQADSILAIMSANGYFIEDTLVTAYISRVVRRLFPPYMEGGNRIYLLKSPDINAATLGNGAFVINAGLLNYARNEAQLASVLGHELGHYISRHLLKSALYESTFLRRGRLNRNAQKNLSSYSVLSETEADSIGFYLLERAGYDVTQAASVFEMLPAGDTSVVPGWLAVILGLSRDQFPTHPKTASRIKFLRTLAAGKPPGLINEQVYIKHSAHLWDDYIKSYKRYNSPLVLAAMLEDTRAAQEDTSTVYYADLLYELGAVYQELYCDPEGTGKDIQAQSGKKVRVTAVFGFDLETKGNLKAYENIKSVLRSKALYYLGRLSNDIKFKNKVNKNLGLIALQDKETEKTKKYFRAYLEAPETFKDKRYIRSLLNDLETKK